MLLSSARTPTKPPLPSLSPRFGAKATADYRGEAIGICATADGARLDTAFQKLAGTVTREGLRLDSTEAEGGGLRLIARSVGRASSGAQRPAFTTQLSASGTVAVGETVVTFTRPGLTEEYSVSVDGGFDHH